jgi:hypothetical protein
VAPIYAAYPIQVLAFVDSDIQQIGSSLRSELLSAATAPSEVSLPSAKELEAAVQEGRHAAERIAPLSREPAL